MVNAQSEQKTQARNEWQAKQKRKGVKINIRHEKNKSNLALATMISHGLKIKV